MAILGGGGGGGTISGVTISGTAAAGQAPIATSSSAGVWAYPPGFEIGYAQITGVTNLTDLAEATATSLISPGALTFDGGAVMVEFFAVGVVPPVTVAGFAIFTLFEGATEIARIADVRSSIAGSAVVYPVTGRIRFTPTAAAHTYKLCCLVSSTTGTPQINAGAGGTAANAPAFLRFTKV